MPIDNTSITSELSIINNNGHYEAYVDKEFYCSGDTFNECYEELKRGGIVNE